MSELSCAGTLQLARGGWASLFLDLKAKLLTLLMGTCWLWHGPRTVSLSLSLTPTVQEEGREEPRLLHKPAGQDRPSDPHQPQDLWPVLLLRSAGL